VNVDLDADARRRYALALRLPEGAVDVRKVLEAPVSRIEIEIGPGRGGFFLGRLEARGDVGLIGFEIKRKWTVIVNERLARSGLADRGRIFAEDIRTALPSLGPEGSIDAMFFHFPDPWWKKRHQKRLVVGTDVLDQCARLLRPRGELFIQTDVEERAALYETQICAHAGFVAAGDAPGAARMAENPYEARSHREKRAIEDRLPIFRLRFARK
jgi:tRNA (guanine-N7-)-methyltransferase